MLVYIPDSSLECSKKHAEFGGVGGFSPGVSVKVDSGMRGTGIEENL